MKKYSFDNLPDMYKILVKEDMDKFEKYLSLMHIEVFEAGEYIINSSSELNTLYFLVGGRAKITLLHENGKRSIVHFVNSKEFIGELKLISIEEEHKDVIAINECICLSISISENRELLLNDSDFLLMLSQYIGAKLLKRTWFNAKIQNYDLKNVLAAYILMTEYKGIYSEKHTETSEFLSVSYRHLLHTLRYFKEEGLIRKTKKAYEINRPELEKLAKDIHL